jgi:mannose-6-phosphate isomerase-like protein (cupin superfamily)
MQISIIEGLEKLKQSGKEFTTLFTHGTLEFGVYKPHLIDKQEPHEKDEIYIIVSGKGKFYNNGDIKDFKEGDFLFVPAGIEHRFIEFSEDCSVWVIFYGAKGGEVK